ncbi:MAG: hypothetical protein ABIK15_17970 [Pseudomonadota bacterium]
MTEKLEKCSIKQWPEGGRPREKRHEQFLVFLLDGQNNLLAERIISEGIPISQAAEIPGRLTPEIKAILEDAGAILERETT